MFITTIPDVHTRDAPIAWSGVVEHFEEARQRLREADREAEEDVVMNVMDCLVGWCSPHMKLPAAADGSSQHVGPG